MTNGLYSRWKPPEEIAAILNEDLQGMKEEIAGMRALCRGLMAMQNQAENGAQMAWLIDAYTLAASRLGEMVKAEKERQERYEEVSWGEQLLDLLVRSMREEGKEVDLETTREMALEGGAGFKAAAERLGEEIASTRLALRRAFHLAMAAEEARERVRMTEVYGRGCWRLTRLLRAEGEGQGRLDTAMREMVFVVVGRLNEE